MIKKIFGPPGSGKTTFLLKTIEEEINRGVTPSRIGYFAFTRRASTEAKDRACLKFGFSDQDLSWFRTLHSLAYKCLSLSSNQIISQQDYKEFSVRVGIKISDEKTEDDFLVKTDNIVLNEINLARIRNSDLRQHYNQSDINVEWHFFEYIERAYRNFKEEKNIYDFTDILEEVAKNPELIPSLETVIVDEAQDLSRLQWNIVKLLADKAKTTYIAGDDDQAIYVWAGADVNSFLDLSGDVKVLSQSYRVPQSVHTLANKIITRVQKRQEKEWSPKEEKGEVEILNDYLNLNLAKNDWLFLASTNHLLNPLHDWLKSQGILFERNGQSSIPSVILNSVLGWESLRSGKKVNFETLKNIYKYLDSSFVKRGHKSLKEADKSILYSLKDLKENHGLLTEKIWHEALTKISQEKRSYIVALLRRKVKLKDTANVRLSTIHGSKGTESDNVVLLTDLSTRFTEELVRRKDNMRRLLYVGVTRTKKKLHLILPENHNKSLMELLC